MPLAICSTKKDDVKACVKAMMKQGYSDKLYQFGRKTYAELEKNQSGVQTAVASKKITNLITLGNGTIHKKTCKKAQGASDAIKASIVRCDLTGLKKCSCMK